MSWLLAMYAGNCREVWGKVQRLVYVSKRSGSKLVHGQVVVPKLGLGLGQGLGRVKARVRLALRMSLLGNELTVSLKNTED